MTFNTDSIQVQKLEGMEAEGLNFQVDVSGAVIMPR